MMRMRMKKLKVMVFVVWVVCVVLKVGYGENQMRCLPKEREALLQFKAAIVDHYDMLSSWSTPHCCQWQGIRCSNLTAHVLGLHLPGQYNRFSRRFISGDIHKSLMELPQLEYLNVSDNSFGYKRIPEFLGSLTNLKNLDLSRSRFGGEIPRLFGSLSHLKYLNLASNFLEGSIPRQLGNLSQLQHLDLSGNSFDGNIPSQLGNLSQLQHLDLSDNFFEGNIPSQLGNLSQLQELYLGGFYGGYPGTLKIDGGGQWLLNLTSLIHLYLESISNFNTSPSLLPTISSKLPKLRELSLIHCGLSDHFRSLNICTLQSLNMAQNNLTEDLPSILGNLSSGCVKHSLQELDLSFNHITGTLPDVSVFSSLKTLVLDGNDLSGEIPQDIILPPQLESLSIQENSFEGGIPKSFGNACALRSLHMSYNRLSEEFSMIIYHLSGCARNSLQELYLSGNQINGTLPDFSIFTSLKRLHISENKLNGEIPKDIQLPSQLEELYMSSNSLKGVLSDYHFANMSKLEALSLSDNSLALEFTQNWVPTFQLYGIELRSCKLGPTFPKWLMTQNNFVNIDISNASISDVVLEWFWANLPLLEEELMVNISYNNLRGIIPNFPEKTPFFYVSLASNQFEGPIPQFLRNSGILDLSKNKFSDSILFLCWNGTNENLYNLDLSDNQLSGQIPNCWSHFKSLTYLDMSHNKFSGKIPTSMGSLFDLQALLLRNNNLENEIPFSLRSCTKLLMLDMAENKLTGPFPIWIGSNLKELRFLSLGSNNLYGTLPTQICYLRNIQLLDLSLNNLFGQIPKCIKNFVAMAQKSSEGYTSYTYHAQNLMFDRSYDLNDFLMWKGSKQMFRKSELILLKSIDLSSNHFSEEIPVEIEDLLELISLNLSRNNLIGKIPSNVGKLASLEFLDLSRNQLVGSIPTSLTQIHRLSIIDLSHNYLTGEIPISTQLQSFNASSYEDNLDLCGLPLEKLCFEEGETQDPNVEVHEVEYSFFNNDFFISMAFGFVVSFWMVFGSILFKRSWRHAYFNFLNNLADNIHIKVAVFAKRLNVDKN